MKITYHIEDGYLGGSRPHYVEIDDFDIEECETQDELNELVEEAVKDHFETHISYYYETPLIESLKKDK